MNFLSKNRKKHIKITLIGDGATGKSSYFERLSNGLSSKYKFNKKYDATIGCNVSQLEFTVNGDSIIVHLFDTAGQEKFGSLRDSYILGSDGIIGMYDISNIDTKNNISNWISNIKRICDENKIKNIPIVVCGNKCDLEKKNKEPRSVYEFRQSSLEGMYNEYGKIKSELISVKSNTNLISPFVFLIKQIYGLWNDPQLIRV